MIHACQKRHRTLGEAPARKSWLRKADVPFDWLLRIADKASPHVRAAFLEALAKAHESATASQEQLNAAVQRKDLAGVMRALGMDEALAEALKHLQTPLENTFIAAARLTAENSTGRLGMRFDITNPKAIDHLRTYNFGLIRQITTDTREGIRRTILDAFQTGGHPYEQARTIRDSIGLTDTQAAAVTNFRRLLENRDRQALSRELRDRRHDRTLDRALGTRPTKDLTPEQIESMVGKYRRRFISLRAETIARTETMRASNAGQNMAWQQAVDEGLMARQDVRRFWLVTPDDRLCPYCEGVPDLNDDGVPLDGTFATDLGPVSYPPLHPNCRCITFIRTE